MLNKDKEYYVFSNNLKAQIEIDEKKAKKGDVDALIRLSRYFRTGETLGFNFYTGEYQLGLFYKEIYDEDDVLVDVLVDMDYIAKEKDWLKGKTYAEKAYNLGDARGFYEYALYLMEESDEEIPSKEVYGNTWIRVKETELDKYKTLGVELIQIDGEYYTKEESPNIEKKETEKSSDKPEFLDCLIKSASLGYGLAKIELGEYYYRIRDFINAEKWYVMALKDDNREILAKAFSGYATVLSDKENEQGNVLQALEYYLKSCQIDNHIDFDKILDFYFENEKLIGFEQLIKIIDRNKKTNIHSYHIKRIIENISEDVIVICSKEIVDLIGDEYLPLELVKKVVRNLEEQDRKNFYFSRLNNTGITVGDMFSFAEEHNLNDSITDDFSAISDLMHQEIEKFAYNALKEYFDAKDSYVLFRLGQILVRGNHFSIDRYFGGIALSDAFVYDNFANAIRKETRKELTDEQLYFLGKKLLVGAYEQGSDIALIELGRVEGEYALKAYNILKDKGLVDCEVTLKLATEYKKEKNYKQAVIVLEEGLKNENGEEVFAEEILRILELTDISLAKNFIIGFLDKVEEGEIKCNCTNFVTNEIIPRVLNKKSYCYQPRYAIKILQSKYFSSPYADYQLGCIYADGEHIRKDIKTAISYFEKAASKDVGSAYYKLGYLYYYGSDGVGKSNIKAKEYFEKALYCGENCEFAYEMVRVDLGEQDGQNLMREYANEVIKETKIGKERNKKIQDDLKEDFGEYWDKLQEKTRDFIYSGIKTYINNYEEDDARYDYSAAINPMAKSLECELGEIFYTKYVKWLQEKGVDVEEYFSEINVKFTSYDKRFTLGLLSFLTHGKKQHFYEYDSAKQYVKENKIPAIVQPNGKGAKVLQLHSKFYDYVNEMFSSDAFSREERQQEITAFIFNLVNLVEDVRENLRNEADHANLMKAGHAEACGNILYKTRKVIYNLVSKLK